MNESMIGAERYWEGRWRDEKAENERLTKMCVDLGQAAMEIGQQLKAGEAENKRLRITINDQAATIVRLEHDNARLHKTLADQFLAFKAELNRLKLLAPEDTP